MIRTGQTGWAGTLKEHNDDPIVQELIELRKAREHIKKLVESLKEADTDGKEVR
jgi:hypothetical protein